MKNIILLFFILTLSACSNRYWYQKSGITNQQMNQDVYQCQKESRYQQSGAVVNSYGGYAASGAAIDHNLVQQCLRAKGYRVENYKFF